jgi:hypothetical protein
MQPRALGLLVILALDLLVAPLAATPPSGKIPLIGVLRPMAADDPHTEAFRRGLHELGYSDRHDPIVFADPLAEGLVGSPDAGWLVITPVPNTDS